MTGFKFGVIWRMWGHYDGGGDQKWRYGWWMHMFGKWGEQFREGSLIIWGG